MAVEPPLQQKTPPERRGNVYTTVEGANLSDIAAMMDIIVSAPQNLPGQPRAHLDLGQLSSLIVGLQLHHPEIFRVGKPA